MSSIEVIVGLLLGAIPIAISACEHWRDVAEKYGRVASFEKQYRRVYADLKDEQVFFRLQLERLLAPLVRGEVIQDGDLERLVADSGDPLWVDEDVSGAIKARLGKAYEGYIRVLGETQQYSLKLLKSLGCDRPEVRERIFGNRAPSNQSSLSPTQKLMANTQRAFDNFNVEFETQRLSFGFNKLKHDDIIQSMHIYNEKLGKFLDLSGEVATLRDGSPPAMTHFAAKHLLVYWKHAERLYSLINRAWGCKCQHLHCAHLWLQHWTSPTFQFRLMVLFAPRGATAGGDSLWQCEGLKIEVSKHEEKAPSMSVPVHSLAPVGQRIPPHKDRRDLLHRAKVKFGSPPAPPPTVQVSSPASAKSIESIKAGYAEITHLCETLASCGIQSRPVGALNDQDDDLHYSVSVQKEALTTARDEIRLSNLLTKSHLPRLNRRTRYAIALAIASSHIQLQSTPWARKQWTARDICFPKDAQGVLLDRPYVSADFNDACVVQRQPAKMTDRSFASLGIILLELCFGKLLDDSECWQNIGFSDEQKPQHLFRLIVAREWADAVEDEEGPEIASAIMWCLNESPTTLEGDQWRRNLADRVLVPIQNCCKYLNRK